MHRLTQVSVPQNHVAIHWFGQSSFALKGFEGKIILIDPYFPHDRPAEKFIHANSPLDESQLPASYVLLTHDHSDHTDIETLKRIIAASPDVEIIGTHESINHLIREGVNHKRLKMVKVGDVLAFDNMTVHVVWAKLPDGDLENGITPPNTPHLGFVIELSGIRIYVSGDPLNTFAQHEILWWPIANLKPDIGFLTTHPDEGEFPFFDGSAEIARKIGLKHAIPSHYQCFVKRNYDAQEWGLSFGETDPEPIIIPYNRMILYPPAL